jgi:hypothetical protein
LDRGVSKLVLDGVAALVGGDGQGGRRPALEVLAREHQPVMQRVVVIAEQLVMLEDLHVVAPGGLQDLLGGFRAAVTGRGGHLAVLGAGRFDPQGGPCRNSHRAYKKQKRQEHKSFKNGSMQGSFGFDCTEPLTRAVARCGCPPDLGGAISHADGGQKAAVYSKTLTCCRRL